MKKITRRVMIAIYYFAITFAFSSSLLAGTVSGKVNFSGTPAANESISMAADPMCASLHSEPVFQETAVVNPNGTLKNVFVYVKEGLEGKTFPTPSTSIPLNQEGCLYHPRVL